MSITASLYASYYFELRTLCEKSERSFTLKPLSDEAKYFAEICAEPRVESAHTNACTRDNGVVSQA